MLRRHRRKQTSFPELPFHVSTLGTHSSSKSAPADTSHESSDLFGACENTVTVTESPHTSAFENHESVLTSLSSQQQAVIVTQGKEEVAALSSKIPIYHALREDASQAELKPLSTSVGVTTTGNMADCAEHGSADVFQAAIVPTVEPVLPASVHSAKKASKASLKLGFSKALPIGRDIFFAHRRNRDVTPIPNYGDVVESSTDDSITSSNHGVMTHRAHEEENLHELKDFNNLSCDTEVYLAHRVPNSHDMLEEPLLERKPRSSFEALKKHILHRHSSVDI